MEYTLREQTFSDMVWRKEGFLATTIWVRRYFVWHSTPTSRLPSDNEYINAAKRTDNTTNAIARAEYAGFQIISKLQKNVEVI
jgi:hypothetical protein